MAKKARAEEGVCPVCGGSLDHMDPEEDGAGGEITNWVCKKCGQAGQAHRELVFARHYLLDDEGVVTDTMEG